MAADAIPRDRRPQTLILGYFDPVYARHADRISELAAGAGTIVAAVDEPPDPFFNWRARAELVASYRCVDFVIHAREIQMLSPDVTVDERGSHEEAKRALIKRVLEKHRSA